MNINHPSRPLTRTENTTAFAILRLEILGGLCRDLVLTNPPAELRTAFNLISTELAAISVSLAEDSSIDPDVTQEILGLAIQADLEEVQTRHEAFFNEQT